MGLETVFAGIGIIIILGFVADWIFSRTNVPDVLWLIIVGMLIGPVLKLVNPGDLGDAASIFTAFALLFILFEGGLHIRIKDLMKSMYGATTLTAINFLLSAIAITFIGKFFGWSWTSSLLLGTILGGTSSSVVVPIVRRLQMGSGNSLVLVLESAFSDVLAIIASITIMQIVEINAVDVGSVLNSLFGSFAIALFVGAIAGFLWILMLERFEALSKSYISTIGVLLIIYGLTEFAKSSGAIAALAFGIVMGNSRKILSLTEGDDTDALSSSARAFFSQISFFVKTFFFVYIGLLMSLTEYGPILMGAVITLAVFLIRPIPVQFSYRNQEHEMDRPIMEAMIPKGLAAAVIVQLAMQRGIPGAEKLLTPVFATILFTIAFTTVMVLLAEKGKYTGTTRLFMKLIGRKPQKSDAEIMRSFRKQAAKAEMKKQKEENKKKAKPTKKEAKSTAKDSRKAAKKKRARKKKALK